MTTKATNSVLNLVSPPIDNMVLLAGTLDNVVIGSHVPNAGTFTNVVAVNSTFTHGFGTTAVIQQINATDLISTNGTFGAIFGDSAVIQDISATSINSTNITGAAILSTGNLTGANIIDNSLASPLVGAPSGTLIGITLGGGLQLVGDVLSVDLQPNVVFDYYLSPTGSDSNNGLSSGSPWLTFAHAVNFVQTHIGLATARLNLADGVYTSGSDTATFFSGTWILQGNNSAPQNVIIQTLGTFTHCVNVGGNAQVSVSGLSVNGAGSVCDGFNIGSVLTVFGPINVMTCTGAQINIGYGGRVIIGSSYTISGNAETHVTAFAGTIEFSDFIHSMTITLQGNPNFSSSFFGASDLSAIIIPSGLVGFAGTSASGIRYVVANNSVIDTQGGGAGYIPGDTPGGTLNGGQYV